MTASPSRPRDKETSVNVDPHNAFQYGQVNILNRPIQQAESVNKLPGAQQINANNRQVPSTDQHATQYQTLSVLNGSTYPPGGQNLSTSVTQPTGHFLSTSTFQPTAQHKSTFGALPGGQQTIHPTTPYVAVPELMYGPNMVYGQAARPHRLTREEINEVMREQMGGMFRTPVELTYRKPYPEYFDRMFEFPRNFITPNFTLFSGEDQTTKTEHIGRFVVQCRDAGSNDFLKLRLFACSLTGSAFDWYVNLPPGSIQTWQDMERAFGLQFYKAKPEVTIVDLARLKQMPGESVESFMARFKQVRSKCHTRLPEADYVQLARDALGFKFKKRFIGQEFGDLRHLITAVSQYERVIAEEGERKTGSKGTYYRNQHRISAIDVEQAQVDDADVAVAEFAGNRPYVCKALTRTKAQDNKTDGGRQFTHNEKVGDTRVYDFDVSKTEQIFDWLFKDKQLKLPEGHIMPLSEDIKGKTYCKWHHSWKHNTYNCVVLRNAIQKAIKEA